MSVPRSVHLLSADEALRRRYGSMSVAVCGELVTSGTDGEEDPHYCAECVQEALRWCAELGASDRG